MPIEIRELVIRATTVSDLEANNQQGPPAPHAVLTDEELTAIIEQCVSQVLKILERKKER